MWDISDEITVWLKNKSGEKESILIDPAIREAAVKREAEAEFKNIDKTLSKFTISLINCLYLAFCCEYLLCQRFTKDHFITIAEFCDKCERLQRLPLTMDVPSRVTLSRVVDLRTSTLVFATVLVSNSSSSFHPNAQRGKVIINVAPWLGSPSAVI